MRPLLALLCLALVAGCAAPGGGENPTTPSSPVATPTATTPTPGEAPYEPSFDGGRAFEHVREQVLRPDGTVRTRVPGTEGNNETASWIADTMAGLGYGVEWHYFNATYGCEPTPMHNVVAERAGTSGRVVVYAAHYDTRPIADKDPTLANRTRPVPGANDGASGVAVLLELARVLPPSNDTVRFVFFDGEDGGGYLGRACTDWILGSRAYAASLSAEGLASIRAFVLVDMVGDPDLLLPYEGYSREGPGRSVQDAIHATARSLGHRQFLDRDGFSILDDHVPFVEAGVPAVDLIHTIPGDPRVFPDWHHTMEDDLDSVSAASLAAVGETLEAWHAASQRGAAAP